MTSCPRGLAPGATATAKIAFGINPDAVIVAQYTAAGLVHGFAALPLPSD